MLPFLHTLEFVVTVAAAMGLLGFLAWKLSGRWDAASIAAPWTRRTDALFRGGWRRGMRASGNSAFDAWRAAELERLENERRALEARHREFAAFLDALKRARDRETFERFMRERTCGGQAVVQTRLEADQNPIAWWRPARAVQHV